MAAIVLSIASWVRAGSVTRRLTASVLNCLTTTTTRSPLACARLTMSVKAALFH